MSRILDTGQTCQFCGVTEGSNSILMLDRPQCKTHPMCTRGRGHAGDCVHCGAIEHVLAVYPRPDESAA